MGVFKLLKKGLLFFTLAGNILIYSCYKEEEGDFIAPDYWKPDFSFPLGRSSLAMDEISGIDSALLLINPLSGYPFWVEELEVPLNDTLPMSFDAFLDDEVERVLIRLNTDNGFPSTINGQIYFLDEGDMVLDSVFQNGPLNLTAGQVTESGDAVMASFESNDAVLDQNTIDNLQTVEKVVVIGAIQNLTLDSNLIQFYSTYKLDVQVGIQIKFNFGSEDYSY